MWKPTTLICVILLTITAVAAAQDENRPTEDFLLRAQARLDTFEFAESIDILTRGLVKLETEVDARAAKIKALVLRAVAYFNLNQLEQARADFRLILEAEPGYQLDSPYVSEAMRSMWRDVVEDMIGILQVTVSPLEADITLDGKGIEPGPEGTVSLLAGRHHLEVFAPDHETYAETVLIQAGEIRVKEVKLERTAASLLLRTVPAGVTVYLDGARVGITQPQEEGSATGESKPLELNGLQKKTYTITLRKDCYREEVSRFNIRKISEFVIKEPFKLEREVAVVQLPSLPPLTRVTVNGEKLNATREEQFEVCPGSRLVIEARSLFGSDRVTIDAVEADGVYGSELELEPTIIQGPSYDLKRRSFQFARSGDGFNASRILRSGSGGDHLLRISALIESLAGEELVPRSGTLTDNQFTVVQNLLAAEGAFFVQIPVLDNEGKQYELFLNALQPFFEFQLSTAEVMVPPDVRLELSYWHGAFFRWDPADDGIYVESVLKGSPADLADLAAGNKVTAINSSPPHALLAMQNRASSGDPLRITVIDKGKSKKLEIQPAALPICYWTRDHRESPVSRRFAALLLADEMDIENRFSDRVALEKARLFSETGFYDKAVSLLASIQEHPERSGLMPGELDYLLYRIHKAAGNLQKADEHRQRVLKHSYVPIYNRAALPLVRLLELLSNEADGETIEKF